jgi:hypothetical protein
MAQPKSSADFADEADKSSGFDLGPTTTTPLAVSSNSCSCSCSALAVLESLCRRNLHFDTIRRALRRRSETGRTHAECRRARNSWLLLRWRLAFDRGDRLGQKFSAKLGATGITAGLGQHGFQFGKCLGGGRADLTE